MTQEECKSFSLSSVSVDKHELMTGLFLIVISFFMPLFFNVQTFEIYTCMMRALTDTEKIDLISAALRLVALNSLRGIPHYVGAYFVGESLSFRRRGSHREATINAALILMILLLTYKGIGAIHNIHYDFGIPAVLVFLFVFFFRKIHYRYISMYKKAAMISMVWIAFQFLDVMPLVSPLPVGRGETSVDIKTASLILEAETAMNTSAMVGMMLFMAFAVILFFQFRQENNLRELGILKEENHNIIVQSKLNEMQNRISRETQYLVHDLKSPLTTVQTLVGVLKMESIEDRRLQDVEYLNCIENAVDRMSKMISEILYEDSQSLITTEELIATVLAQSSVTDYATYLHVENTLPDAFIMANRFLFPRALINLLQNSAQAVPKEREPDIRLTVSRAAEPFTVAFTVEDNGVGIAKERLEAVWEHGISDNQSSGLGLAFVKNVVKNMGGNIKISSEEGAGTKISLEFPQEQCNTNVSTM